MTGILSELENVTTLEDENTILNSFITQLVNNSADDDSENFLEDLIVVALTNYNKRTYKENILMCLEDQWEKFESIYSNGSYKVRENVIGLLLACTSDGYLPGKELLSFAMCRKNLFEKKTKTKKSKNKKAKKNKTCNDNDEYYLQAKVAVECAHILIALILKDTHSERLKSVHNISEPLKVKSLWTLCELSKPTTYFSNKVDGQDIDIKVSSIFFFKSSNSTTYYQKKIKTKH